MMSAYAAPGKRLTITSKGSSYEDKESTWLRLFAGFLFVGGCSCFLVGATLNLPQVGGGDAWMYHATGAGIFILCGLVECCNYMGGFHVFLIFAGILGLAAQVLDGRYQNPLSVHFNFLSNHMFFCEAVKIYYAHQEDCYFMEIASKYIMIKTLRLADIFFVLGTTMDVVLAWIYLFTGPPGSPNSAITASGDSLNMLRSDDQKIAEVASACLWFCCSVLTFIVYARTAKMHACAGEEDEFVDEKKALTNLSSGV